MDLSLKPDPNNSQLLIVLFVFLGTVLFVFSTFAAQVAYRIIQRLRHKSPKPLNLFERVIFLLGTVGILCIVYGLFIEPYWLSVTTIPLSSEKLASVSRPIRLVQISDLHCDPTARLEETLPDVIAAQHPDLILFTGDALNSPGGMPILHRCLTRLATIAPTYVVKGNWDAWYFKDCDRFAGTGVVQLDGSVKTHVAGTDIWLCGLPVGTSKTIANVMSSVPENAFTIFLYHYPDFIEEMAKNRVDLYLAGHTHGGQVALPIYGALMTLSSRGKQFESGLYEYGQTHLYVNRGIGMEGGKAPRIRFWARPEVTVFELSAKPL